MTMSDAEIRGKLLTHFYGLRHDNGGWVPLSDMITSPAVVSLQVLCSVCDQLGDVGLIHWKPLRTGMGFVAGNARITGSGVAAVESGQSPDIDIQFPASTAPVVSAPSASDDVPFPEDALSEVRAAVSAVSADLPSLSLSNSAKADITSDITLIEAEIARPVPRRKFLKIFLEGLRDNLAKATATGLVQLIAGLIAKYFHVF